LPLVCFCGWPIPGNSTEERASAFRSHTDEAHQELRVQDHDVTDYLDALERMDPPGPRRDAIAAVEVSKTTPDRIDDFLDFFDHRAFADYPIWASCYCMFHHVPSADWPSRPAAQNRADIAERLRRGETTGYLAYVDGTVAGWCNASDRALYADYGAEQQEDRRVGAIVCFTIAAPYRRHGVAGALLEAAVAGFRADGYDAVEGYPRPNADTDSGSYPGPLQMYLDAGFQQVREEKRWIVVRKDLTAP
jgi:GNAT superfamily N-acetyltransferase